MADSASLVQYGYFATIHIPSDDCRPNVLDDGNSRQYDMADYHVLSMDDTGIKVIAHAGVAVSHSLEGPSKPGKEPFARIHGVDPVVLVDADGAAYLCFGGPDKFDGEAYQTMEATEGVFDLVINDSDGKPIQASEHDRRFFEAAWMDDGQWPDGRYLFSCSTGDTRFIVCQGRILGPFQGWTTRHSIVEFKANLAYDDAGRRSLARPQE
ncbi:glycoside hydrolase family 43 protein [Dothistroma septosporum NZE10]|uniref:Glycoside hydrolase family 43 protein n=1 Tax=Dothistroma septosporum (strain NZE10 / CBS 128990) TaxID=675120 RepID=N1Q279_DOTSN|nr:glycoside hydrolase family 43 protein [Dothistroma septosporum NZE10]